MCGARGHRNGKTRTSLSTTTMTRLSGPLKFRSLWPRRAWQWSLIPHTHMIWPPVIFPLLQAEASDEGSKIRHHWRDSRGIAAGTWKSSKKRTSRVASKHGKNTGNDVFVQKGSTLKVMEEFNIQVKQTSFTSTVLELLDTSLYNYHAINSSRAPPHALIPQCQFTNIRACRDPRECDIPCLDRRHS